ncbi:MAG: hypothetical protein ACR2LQ_12675 [Acidimicrobiales bacterium]
MSESGVGLARRNLKPSRVGGHAGAPKEGGHDRVASIGTVYLEGDAAVIDGDGEGEERAALLLGLNQRGELGNGDRLVEPDANSSVWHRRSSLRVGEDGVPCSKPFGHRAGVERARDAWRFELGGQRHRGRGTVGRFGDAGAGTAVAARSIDRGPRELAGRGLQLRGEPGELGDLSLGVGDLVGDEVVEASLHRVAVLPAPDRDEVGDLPE